MKKSKKKKKSLMPTSTHSCCIPQSHSHTNPLTANLYPLHPTPFPFPFSIHHPQQPLLPPLSKRRQQPSMATLSSIDISPWIELISSQVRQEHNKPEPFDWISGDFFSIVKGQFRNWNSGIDFQDHKSWWRKLSEIKIWEILEASKIYSKITNLFPKSILNTW